MAAISVINRIREFLHKYDPFSYLDGPILNEVATSIKVLYYEDQELIFKQGDPTNNLLYVLRKGKIQLFTDNEKEKQLVDICDVGQSFGVRSLLTENPYIMDAVAEGDALVYAIPLDTFKMMTEENPKVALFYAQGFASGMPLIPSSPKTFSERKKSFRMLQNNTTDRDVYLQDLVVVKPSRRVVAVKPTVSVKRAAEVMTFQRVGSLLIIDENNYPVGIITGNDFIRKVVSQEVPYDAPVQSIMSSPVITVAEHQNVALNLLYMTKKNVRHLVITEDGSDKSRVLGVISERDLMMFLGRQPATVIKRMHNANSLENVRHLRDAVDPLIKNYLDQELSTQFVCEVASQINDTMIQRILELSLEELEKDGFQLPAIKYCWVSLGSEGRKEQLLKTDQDNALIFENVNEDKILEIRKKFLTLADKVNRGMNYAGYEMCPAEVMARNPNWCLSLDEWKSKFDSWTQKIDNESILHATIFFDFRLIYGDQGLVEELRTYSYQAVQKNQLFLPFLAKQALNNPPPLSFFKNLVLERDGKYKDLFDLKKRGIMPLVDAARVLALENQLSNAESTLERFEELKKIFPEEAALYEACHDAFQTLLRYRALSGFKYNDSGRYIRPENLQNIEKQMLRFVFNTISDLQTNLKMRFKLALL